MGRKDFIRPWTWSGLESPAIAQKLFLAIAAPTILLLCFLTGPFEVADEPAHFLRMVAVAQGQWRPVVSPLGATKKSVGAFEDAAVVRLAGQAQDIAGWGMHHYSIAELRERGRTHESGKVIFAPHAAAIYPPFLYMVSSAATVAAKTLRLPPLWWLYLGRLANAVITIVIIQAALRRAGDAALVLFACTILPMNLYEAASVSADALLFPLVIAFVVLLLRIERGERYRAWDTFTLAASTILVCAGKVAYLPFALLPPVSMRLVDKRWSYRALWSAGAALLSGVLWFAWALIVQNKVFSIRPHLQIDPKEQLIRLISDPIASAIFFLHSMAVLTPKLAIGAVGTRLGWGDLHLPWWSIYPLPFFVLAAALPAEQPGRRLRAITTTAVLVAFTCYCAIFLLIYLQFNEVGARVIIGVQGRYFMPLAILLLAVIPKLKISRERMKLIWAGAALVAIANCVLTLVAVQQRYW